MNFLHEEKIEDAHKVEPNINPSQMHPFAFEHKEINITKLRVLHIGAQERMNLHANSR